MPKRTRQVTDFLGLTTQRAPLPWWVVAVPLGVLTLVSVGSLIALPEDEARAVLLVLLVISIVGLACTPALRRLQHRRRSR